MIWDSYPRNYRSTEIDRILKAVGAGESVSVVGLSGAGKSNLVGFLAHRWPEITPQERAAVDFSLIDCNRLPSATPEALYQAVGAALGEENKAASELEALTRLLADRFRESEGILCLILDRFDIFSCDHQTALAGNLRALRDDHKYRLTYLVTTRRPLNPETELAELFFGSTIWLGPLSRSDAEWSASAYAQRHGEKWDDSTLDAIIELSGGYPSFLRAVCEAYADVKSLDAEALANHATLERRLSEFWADAPSDEHLRLSSLSSQPLLSAAHPGAFDTSKLTAKEHALLNHFLANPREVCEKNELIVAVWPEDRVYEEGVRDDSLAQLVRRLRKKLEPEPSEPRYFQTVPGRGYRFTP